MDDYFPDIGDDDDFFTTTAIAPFQPSASVEQAPRHAMKLLRRHGRAQTLANVKKAIHRTAVTMTKWGGNRPIPEGEIEQIAKRALYRRSTRHLLRTRQRAETRAQAVLDKLADRKEEEIYEQQQRRNGLMGLDPDERWLWAKERIAVQLEAEKRARAVLQRRALEREEAERAKLSEFGKLGPGDRWKWAKRRLKRQELLHNLAKYRLAETMQKRSAQRRAREKEAEEAERAQRMLHHKDAHELRLKQAEAARRIRDAQMRDHMHREENAEEQRQKNELRRMKSRELLRARREAHRRAKKRLAAEAKEKERMANASYNLPRRGSQVDIAAAACAAAARINRHARDMARAEAEAAAAKTLSPEEQRRADRALEESRKRTRARVAKQRKIEAARRKEEQEEAERRKGAVLDPAAQKKARRIAKQRAREKLEALRWRSWKSLTKQQQNMLIEDDKKTMAKAAATMHIFSAAPPSPTSGTQRERASVRGELLTTQQQRSANHVIMFNQQNNKTEAERSTGRDAIRLASRKASFRLSREARRGSRAATRNTRALSEALGPRGASSTNLQMPPEKSADRKIRRTGARRGDRRASSKKQKKGKRKKKDRRARAQTRQPNAVPVFSRESMENRDNAAVRTYGRSSLPMPNKTNKTRKARKKRARTEMASTAGKKASTTGARVRPETAITRTSFPAMSIPSIERRPTTAPTKKKGGNKSPLVMLPNSLPSQAIRNGISFRLNAPFKHERGHNKRHKVKVHIHGGSSIDPKSVDPSLAARYPQEVLNALGKSGRDFIIRNSTESRRQRPSRLPTNGLPSVTSGDAYTG